MPSLLVNLQKKGLKDIAFSRLIREIIILAGLSDSAVANSIIFCETFLSFSQVSLRLQRTMESVDNLPPFCSMMRGATGGTEIWTHSNNTLKMYQYGWRCTTNEDLYSTATLIGNYNEERFDLKEIKKNKPLPSQFAHYYQPICAESYNKSPLHRYPDDLKKLKRRLPNAYSVHQPELDTPQHKAFCNSWQTTHRTAYLHPQLRLQPIVGPPAEKPKPCP
ncbi:hypothetical protein Btru_064431 [Bulinus truncatus]|nr:hypothetical protein Btru_064431 [Bulinus truncatus]